MGYKTIDSLEVGERVVGSNGRLLEVSRLQVHPMELRRLVTLCTAQSELTVTLDHRVAVPQSEGSERLARELCVGDNVLCGSQAAKLVKVVQYEERVELVEVDFNADKQ